MTIRISGEPPKAGTVVALYDDQGFLIGNGTVTYRHSGLLSAAPGVDAVLNVDDDFTEDETLITQSDSREDFYLVLDR